MLIHPLLFRRYIMTEEKKPKKTKKDSAASTLQKLIKDLEGSDKKQDKFALINLRQALKFLK